MQLISLSAISNQKFSIQLSSKRHTITLKETNGVMSCTIVRDDETIVDNIRLVAGTPILPYAYMQDGNFILVTENDDLPDWTKFGNGQELYYVTAAELEGIVNA